VSTPAAMQAGELAKIMTAALRRRGVSEQHAGFVVDGLVEASLRGIDTHGVRLFETYLSELDGGRSLAAPELRWSGDKPAARSLDAGHALGLVAGRVACERAAELARASGIGAVSVRNSNHFGAASVYTLALARVGLLGLAFSNSDALVAPVGGRRPFFGTNPVSMAVAGEGEELFCADFATSQVSYSRVKAFRAQGRKLEPGWAITGENEELLALEPLGGHKGQCLGMMVEILCVLLAGMPFDHQLSHLYDPPFDQPRQVSHLFLAMDLEAFGSAAAFRQNLSRLLEMVRQEPGQPIAPGDLEKASTVTRLASGIPLSEVERAFFGRIAAE
jgi:ureidoglycolate dehydrogenase (NAD+)